MPQNPEIEGLRPGRGLSLKLQAHKPNCGRRGRSLENDSDSSFRKLSLYRSRHQKSPKASDLSSWYVSVSLKRFVSSTIAFSVGMRSPLDPAT